jgi:hypothetical protein
MLAISSTGGPSYPGSSIGHLVVLLDALLDVLLNFYYVKFPKGKYFSDFDNNLGGLIIWLPGGSGITCLEYK